MTSSTIFSITYVLFCIGFLFYGYQNRKLLLDKNISTMTYSYTASSQVKMNRTLPGYNLWRVNYPKSDHLNKQPVLFIPGSGGRMEQVYKQHIMIL